jgi:hypothetical protein
VAGCRLASSPRASFFPRRGGRGSLFDPAVAAPTPAVVRRLPPSLSWPRRRRPEIRPRCGDSLPTRAAAHAPGGAAEVRWRRTKQCGRLVVVVASLAWGTEDRRLAAVWSWPGGGGPWPALLFFLFFFIFLCREYLGGARQRAGDAVSLWDGRRPLFFAVRHILRTTKAYAVRCLSQRRTAKVFAGQKCAVRPLPCARAESARQRLCRVGSGLWRGARQSVRIR